MHHLRAAQGWLELRNHLEANKELEEIPDGTVEPPQLVSKDRKAP